MRLALSLAAPLALAACAYGANFPAGRPAHPLINAAGQQIGVVRTLETPGGVSLQIDAASLPPGLHGLHVHSAGRCDAPSFASAGPHWNPTAARHGANAPDGPHRGDLANLVVPRTGRLLEVVSLPAASLAALADGDGSALLIHAAPDDYRTDPSGNSGPPIACAVLAP